MRYPLQVYVGKTRHYAKSRPSAIIKYQVEGELQLRTIGLSDDEQADDRVHGGPDRALCHYPREHYAFWQRQFPELVERFAAPAFGENLSTTGMTEHNVYMGDIYRWGAALIQVTQPRSPCFKLNFHFQINNLAALLQESGRVGWLYRVIAPGRVSGREPLELVSRLSEMSVYNAAAIAWHMPFDDEQYHCLLSVAGLSSSWSKTLQTRRLTGKIENYNHRLLGK